MPLQKPIKQDGGDGDHVAILSITVKYVGQDERILRRGADEVGHGLRSGVGQLGLQRKVAVGLLLCGSPSMAWSGY